MDQQLKERSKIMLEVKHSIDINADAKIVYEHFMNRPFKFASNKLLERKPFLMARLLISPVELFLKSRNELETKMIELTVGRKYGPFDVVAIDPGKKVTFGLYHPPIAMNIAFVFKDLGNETSQLSLVDDIIADTFLRRLSMPITFNFMIIHSLFAKIMLKVYKQEIESKEPIGVHVAT